MYRFHFKIGHRLLIDRKVAGVLRVDEVLVKELSEKCVSLVFVGNPDKPSWYMLASKRDRGHDLMNDTGHWELVEDLGPISPPITLEEGRKNA